MRTPGSLDPRAQSILRAVIEEYVETAIPVGSAALVERYRLGVSSATVRNILADLEAAGLLTHPHTSAGRVPTDAGYRFFVESIGESAIIPPVEQLMIRHQFGQVQHASEQWFRLAATILAGANRNAAIATAAKPRAAHVRRIDLVTISDRLASLIIVFREGALRQVLVNLPEAIEQQ
jgi:heat-inducible transcriptional repressor